MINSIARAGMGGSIGVILGHEMGWIGVLLVFLLVVYTHMVAEFHAARAREQEDK